MPTPDALSRMPSLFDDRALDGPRARAVREITRLAETVLPARAAGDDRYPVQLDHCFKRIAFDDAVEARWDTVVEPPFYANASLGAIQRAVEALTTMAETPAAARALNRQSLEYRRAA